jgi:hypothetical protein
MDVVVGDAGTGEFMDDSRSVGSQDPARRKRRKVSNEQLGDSTKQNRSARACCQFLCLVIACGAFSELECDLSRSELQAPKGNTQPHA